MTYVPPEIQPLPDGAEPEPENLQVPAAADLVDPTPELVNRLAAMELRLRLMETAEPAEPVSPSAALGVLRPRTAAPAATSPPLDDPLDERSMVRSEWAAEALTVLSETIARQRARNAEAERELRETQARLVAERDVAVARSAHLQESLTRTYSQAQGVQEVVGELQASRSYRIGHRLARLAGRQGPNVTTYATPIAQAADPNAVAVVSGSGVFDADWYATTYPDVIAAGADPLSHFMTQARTEHRCPGPLFDTGWYLGAYGDQVPADVNPLAYYLTTGWRAGHRPWETFDPEDYLRQHPELTGLDVCPLVHLAASSAQ